MHTPCPQGAPGRAPDPDPQETAEWLEALDAVLHRQGSVRARQLLDALAARAQQHQLGWRTGLNSPYVNTIAAHAQAPFPGDLAQEERIAALVRWNALAMVVRANQAHGELGGHIASFASAADLFEVGFNHFFRARTKAQASAAALGDLVFFQPHSAPGVYARAFMEGRLHERDLHYYRRELAAADDPQGARGLCSYPHPTLMPDFWQFPTGSMGLGPISSIYQARFMRYLEHRGLLDSAGRTVWGFFGDGEMDEPESMSALTLAARENLDNLVWVVNCNLQRLDGPVRGNGRIIDELERLFVGAGWNVVKLVWGSDWDGLLARDHDGALLQALAQTVDGQMQTFAANDGRFNREHFFGQNPALARLVEGLSDEQIDRLRRGGHDMVKIHAAYAAALAHRGQPSVVLAHTKKGFGMGKAGQGKMTTHSQKKLDEAELLAFRDRFALPLSDAQVRELEFYRPAPDSATAQYLRQQRERLGGYLPRRYHECPVLPVPALRFWAGFALDAAGREMSTTMAFVRMLGALLKDATLGPRTVPIVADEARTFGMAALFKQVGIYSSVGQCYDPEDIGSVMSYREARDGQILEEGISEAGAIASWTAAATSYSVHGLAMLPFYIYYSMFGFQRVGDAIWAAADQRARGFLIGATSGRTTLGGEGLQHQDGSSHLVAATIPHCRAYDPAFAGELAIVLEHGMRQMLEQQQDLFYYLTVMNANYAQPSIGAEHAPGIIAGGYRHLLLPAGPGAAPGASITLMGSGAILTEVLAAAQRLHALGVDVEVVSVTSWSELARGGRDRGEAGGVAWVTQLLSARAGPVLAASDYVCAVPQAIQPWVPAHRPFRVLGTDGFGRSDTRERLRQHFGVDAAAIVRCAQAALAAAPPSGAEVAPTRSA